MTIYITCTKEPLGTTLRVDGWLKGADADELLRVVLSAAAPVTLNLTDLRSADRQGVSVLRQLGEQGVEMIGMSDYLQLILERASSTEGGTGPERGEST